MRRAYAYRSAVTLTDTPEALEAIRICKESDAKAVDYLAQWDIDGDGDVTDIPPWGTESSVVFINGYYLHQDKILDSILDSIGITAPVTKEQYYHWFGRYKGEFK